MSIDAQWDFPPSNGGAEFVQDPSSAHFSDLPPTFVPLVMLVRQARG